MPWRLFTNEYWSPTSVKNHTNALKLTHQLSAKTFYKILIKHDYKDYYTNFTKEAITEIRDLDIFQDSLYITTDIGIFSGNFKITKCI